MDRKSSVIEVDVGRLAEICQRYGIAELHVFGSVARGQSRDDSDIDLLYRLLPGVRLGWEIEELNDELAGLFGRPVDLVSARAVHPRLRTAVHRDARQLYAA